MIEKKTTPINKDKLFELITILEADMPKLETDESYQRHEPLYYNYVVYYDDLVETLLQVCGKDKISIFGTYLVGLLAYQVVELQKPLYDAVGMILSELKLKYDDLIKDKSKSADDEDDDGPFKYQA